jgi:apolipoprotein N-acyltransferase
MTGLLRRKSGLPSEPEEIRSRRHALRRIRILLCVLSGTMLGFSFPPSPFGILACFGLVPLLIVLADIEEIGRALRYSYVAFFVFHLITLNWTGGFSHGNDPYMMIAGSITILAHPFFYFIPVAAYLFVRRKFGDHVALAALPFLWVSYEYSHSLTEWSFPWLTLGNSQTFDLARIQFISATGVYGLSLWILLMNVLGFILYSHIARAGGSFRSSRVIGLVGLIVVIDLLPLVHGLVVLSGADAVREREPETAGPTITVGIVQSNVDPWDKWSVTGFDVLRLYVGMTRSLVHDASPHRPDLVLWPETAVPYLILTDQNQFLLSDLRSRLDSIGVPVLTGLPQAVFYRNPSDAPPSAKTIRRTGERYDAFNAAALIQPGRSEIPWYGKMKMVPFAERVPYADIFHAFDFLRWNVGIGGWQIGRDTTIFTEGKTGTRFATLICYESVYPDLVAAFVRKGAEFISIVTIDSWWGKMSGAYQHHQFALLRAVENRRWIARCAVGGISCYIDPYGRTYDNTDLFTQAKLVRTLHRRTDLSLYSEHGDWLGLACAWLSCAFLAAALGQAFLNKKRDQAWQNNSSI